MKYILLFLVLLTFGCKESRVYNVGILVGVDSNIPVAEAFIDEMETLGYIRNENITYDIRVGKSDMALMEDISREFVSNKVDLILSVTHGASVTAKNVTKDSGIPVVFSYAITSRGDLIDSIANPGGNITGVRYPIPDMAIKRTEFILDINPDIDSILLPHRRDYPPAMIVIDGLKEFLKGSDIELIDAPFDSLEDMTTYFTSLIDEKKIYGSVMALPEPFIYSDKGWSLIRDYSYTFNVPIVANSDHMTRDGALFSYSNIDIEMGNLAAPIANSVLKGADPGTIPVVTPKVYLHINKSRAKELGLAFPDSMIKLAEEIIE